MCLCKQSNVDMRWVRVCVYVSIIINQISSRQLLVCVCNGIAPGSANIRLTMRCTNLCMRDQAWVGVCVCLPQSLSSRQLLVCLCMHMYVYTAERLQLHKAVILLMIMKYFVLKIVSYSQYKYTMKPYQ